jgi:hypothetical protein
MPLGLVQLVPSNPTAKINTPLPRLWLIFFGEAGAGWWWTWFFRRGFRHVCAASWYAGAERWVYFNPVARGTVVEVMTDAEFGPRFQQLIRDSSAILRMRTVHERSNPPAAFFCVGAIKGLLGIKACALGPWGLYRHLLARGAEIVPRPREDDIGLCPPINRRRHRRRSRPRIRRSPRNARHRSSAPRRTESARRRIN